jgi:hypothetical protein
MKHVTQPAISLLTAAVLLFVFAPIYPSLAAISSVPTNGDVCGVKAKGAAFLDSHNAQSSFVKGHGLKLLMSIQGFHPLRSGHRSIDQFELLGLTNPWTGLAYIYSHGNTYHACGVGTAVTDYQALPSYKKHFILDETVTLNHTWARLHLGKRLFVFSGKTMDFHYKP